MWLPAENSKYLFSDWMCIVVSVAKCLGCVSWCILIKILSQTKISVSKCCQISLVYHVIPISEVCYFENRFGFPVCKVLILYNNYLVYAGLTQTDWCCIVCTSVPSLYNFCNITQFSTTVPTWNSLNFNACIALNI